MRFRGILNDVYGHVLRACASWGFNFKIRTCVHFFYTDVLRKIYDRITNVYIVIMRTQCELYANAMRKLCDRNAKFKVSHHSRNANHKP